MKPAHAQHSPLPWSEPHKIQGRTPDQYEIMICRDWSGLSNIIIKGNNSENDAAHIVRACNNAQRLADALKAALPLMEMWMQQHPHVDQTDNCATAAREALAQWEGGAQ